MLDFIVNLWLDTKNEIVEVEIPEKINEENERVARRLDLMNSWGTVRD